MIYLADEIEDMVTTLDCYMDSTLDIKTTESYFEDDAEYGGLILLKSAEVFKGEPVMQNEEIHKSLIAFLTSNGWTIDEYDENVCTLYPVTTKEPPIVPLKYYKAIKAKYLELSVGPGTTVTKKNDGYLLFNDLKETEFNDYEGVLYYLGGYVPYWIERDFIEYPLYDTSSFNQIIKYYVHHERVPLKILLHDHKWHAFNGKDVKIFQTKQEAVAWLDHDDTIMCSEPLITLPDPYVLVSTEQLNNVISLLKDDIIKEDLYLYSYDPKGKTYSVLKKTTRGAESRERTHEEMKVLTQLLTNDPYISNIVSALSTTSYQLRGLGELLGDTKLQDHLRLSVSDDTQDIQDEIIKLVLRKDIYKHLTK